MSDDATPNKITDASQALAFLLAGNATATLVSTKTGARFTFKVRAIDEPRTGGPSHFVNVLTSGDNEGGFTYLGVIRSGRHEHGRKSRVDANAPSARAFAWTFANLTQRRLPDVLEFWHEGRCGACGRKLTVPSSIASGFGPECSKRMSCEEAA